MMKFYLLLTATFLSCPFLSEAQELAPIPIVTATFSTPEEEDSLRSIVLLAHEEARCTMDEIYQSYLRLKDTSLYKSLEEGWNGHEDFPKWLGAYEEDEARKQEIEERIKTLRDWLWEEEITYKIRLGLLSYCELTHSTAYTSQLNRKKVINLCPHWFRCRGKQQAATIIHELVHKMGFGHPRGTVTTPQAILLARKFPQKAIRSPENFEGLAESFYCQLYTRR